MKIFMLVMYFYGTNYTVLGEPFDTIGQCQYYATYKNTFSKPANVKIFKCITFEEVK